MAYNPKLHNRKSLRLRSKDYRSGSYFITICGVNREWLFGEIKHEEMMMNELGIVVEDEWLKTKTIRPNVKLDAYVVMPNHFHAILHLEEKDLAPVQYLGGRGIEHMMDEHHPNTGCSEHHRRGIARYAPTDAVTKQNNRDASKTGKFHKIIPDSLGSIIRGFKSATTRHINRLRNSTETSVWQRNYYEHAIRNAEELQKTRTYIQKNPKYWFADEEYTPHKYA